MGPLRRVVGCTVALALASLAVVLLPGTIDEAAAASTKITICHRTHSTTNPYRRITVSQNAVTNARHGGHKVPSGSSNPAVFDSTFTYVANNKIWGDIIPGSTSGGSAYNGTNAIALNWTAAGIADFNGACAPMTAKQFYDQEIAAGESAQSVIDDLNEQAANEDAALLASIGGSFSTSNVTSWDTAVSVATTAATSVGTTTATVNGTITVGSISTAIGFDYGTSSTLATFTSVSAGANVSGVTGQAITKALTGLTSGTTYYVRATGTTNAGSDTEGILYGSILSFTTTGSSTQSITFDQPADMSLGGGTQTLTSATADTSGLPVTFTSTTPGVCTVAGAVVTAVDAGTCSITASQTGDTTYAAATPVTRTLAVTATSRTLSIDGSSYTASYVVNATPPTITSTASAGDTDGTKSYSSTTAGVCTVGAASGVVTFVSAGSCTIGAAISSGGVYRSATASTVTFSITATSRTLTIDPSSYAAGGYAADATGPTIASTPSAGSGTTSYASTTPSVCTIGATSGLVTFLGAGTCTIRATIGAAGGYDAATSAPISFPVTSAAPQTAPAATTTTTSEPATTTTVPTTPTTTPSPSATTTPSSPVSPAADGSIQGVVWFDRNRSGSFDGREWILPGIQVTLTQLVVSAADAAGDFGAAALPLTFSVVTDREGRYLFGNVPPGRYEVSAVARIKGFDYTSDTDGGADWRVGAEVTAARVGIADFAGLGRGQILGRMFEESTGDGLAFATIECRWAGLDDVRGNADDVPFELTSDAQGRFDMVGVPYGNFTCAGTDSLGRRSRGVTATVFSSEPRHALLPVGRDASLPETGSSPIPLVELALLCLTLGGAAVFVSRRPGREG